MTQNADHTLLAVDGGGTSCRFALSHRGQRHEIKRGAANYTTDPEASIATLRAGLDTLRAQAGIAATVPIPTFIGIAGVMDAADGIAIAAALNLTHAQVADDRPAAVRGGLGQGDGFVASLGTGSFFARQRAGAIRLAGGWGSRLGDEASGYWIGRALLAWVLRAADGLSESSRLTASVLTEFDNSTKALVRFARSAAPGQIAAYSEKVGAAADDPVGRAILSAAADEVAKTLQGLGWSDGERICLMGSVAQSVRAFLPSDMGRVIAAPQGTALDGALALAGDIALQKDDVA